LKTVQLDQIDTNLSLSNRRIEIIDIMRGFAMLLMLLDHARTFLFNNGLPLLDPKLSGIFLYFTRWITHLAAPAFVFLAGVSAFLKMQKSDSRSMFRNYLFGRGLFLVILEFTLVAFLWRFQLDMFLIFQVIAVIGVGFILLAVFQYLPSKLLLIIALLFLFGHNLFDYVAYHTHPSSDIIRKFLLMYANVNLFDTFAVRIVYPIIPWFGVMLLGFSCGKIFLFEEKKLKKTFFITAAGLFVLFIIVRLLNSYGNHYLWMDLGSLQATMLSLFNCSKYPPSLSFLFIIFSLLAFISGIVLSIKKPFFRFFAVFGKVPLFFYMLHLFLLHFMAVFMFKVFKGIWLRNLFENSGILGFPLVVSWLVFVISAAVLYPICRWYGVKNRKNRVSGFF